MRKKWGAHGNRFSFETAQKAFLQKVMKDRVSGCWNWMGARSLRYGSIGFQGRNTTAHRVAWMLFKGEDPGELYICHKCDNGFCVRPSHLFKGTQTDNVHDMEHKKRARHPTAEKHGRSKLTWADVRRIRKLHKSGVAIRAIARMYPFVDRSNIAAVVHRITWITT